MSIEFYFIGASRLYSIFSCRLSRLNKRGSYFIHHGINNLNSICMIMGTHIVKMRANQVNNKKFEIMLTRRAKAYSSSGSVV